MYGPVPIIRPGVWLNFSGRELLVEVLGHDVHRPGEVEGLEVRLLELEHDLVVVHLLDRLDPAKYARSRGRLDLLVHDPIEREDDVVGVEGLAVGKRHALGELEDHSIAVGALGSLAMSSRS